MRVAGAYVPELLPNKCKLRRKISTPTRTPPEGNVFSVIQQYSSQAVVGKSLQFVMSLTTKPKLNR